MATNQSIWPPLKFPFLKKFLKIFLNFLFPVRLQQWMRQFFSWKEWPIFEEREREREITRLHTFYRSSWCQEALKKGWKMRLKIGPQMAWWLSFDMGWLFCCDKVIKNISRTQIRRANEANKEMLQVHFNVSADSECRNICNQNTTALWKQKFKKVKVQKQLPPVS